MPITSSGEIFHIKENELQLLFKEAESGDLSAANKLYHYYTFSNYDDKKSLHWLKVSAELGSGVAQYNLAQHYFYEEKNHSEANYWAEKAIISGQGDAKEFIARNN